MWITGCFYKCSISSTLFFNNWQDEPGRKNGGFGPREIFSTFHPDEISGAPVESASHSTRQAFHGAGLSDLKLKQGISDSFYASNLCVVSVHRLSPHPGNLLQDINDFFQADLSISVYIRSFVNGCGWFNADHYLQGNNRSVLVLRP